MRLRVNTQASLTSCLQLLCLSECVSKCSSFPSNFRGLRVLGSLSAKARVYHNEFGIVTFIVSMLIF